MEYKAPDGANPGLGSSFELRNRRSGQRSLFAQRRQLQMGSHQVKQGSSKCKSFRNSQSEFNRDNLSQLQQK
jgi:hypothetical protein